MNKSKWISILSSVATIVGVIASLASDYANTQQMKEEVSKQVNEALAQRDNNKEES
jgi:hypothetical protein